MRVLFHSGLYTVLCLVFLGCGDKKNNNAQNSGEKIPKDIRGLVIDGPRPKDNVIHNMAPVVKHWRKRCKDTFQSECKGNITIEINVTNLGEIGVKSYTSTLPDSSFVRSLIDGLYVQDFDPWNDNMDDTRIVYPVEF